jgi:glutathione S-transferase
VAIKLHRCKNVWAKFGGHPCWKVQKALDDMNIQYEVVPLPWPGRGKRENLERHTGSTQYPAIEFADGTWYREESKDMAAAIRAGKLDEKHGVTPAAQPAA